MFGFTLFPQSDIIDRVEIIMLKQYVRTILYSLFAALAVSVVGSVANAQSSPPISPWMGMFDRPNNPTLGNYLGNVRPQQEMMRSSASQASQIQSQQRALQSLLQPPSGGGAPGSGSGAQNLARASSVAASGGASDVRNVLAAPREVPRAQRNPAGFNQYLHYYPPYAMQRKPVPNYSATGRRR